MRKGLKRKGRKVEGKGRREENLRGKDEGETTEKGGEKDYECRMIGEEERREKKMS